MQVLTKQARRFQLTLNQPDKYDDLLKYLSSLKSLRYLLSAKEKAPTTGHEHIHVFVCFKTGIRLSQSKTQGAHIEICRGSNEQNINYLTEEGEILHEIGQRPQQGCSHTVSDLLKLDNPLELPAHSFKTWSDVKNWNRSMTREKAYKPGVKIFFIWGDSGTGKTRYVYDHLGDVEFDRVKHVNGFWTGVSIDPSVVTAWYDDFRDSDMKPSEFINFIDYYSNNMNIKGGHVPNHYQLIYITSIQNPKEMYSGMLLDEPRRQWLRRMEIIHLE